MPARRQPVPISRPLHARRQAAAAALSPSAQSRPFPKGRLLEIGCKLGIDLSAILVAFAALSNLVPHYWSQQVRLRAIRAEVARTERRVTRLQARLDRNLDPRQAEAVMQEQTARVRPEFWPIKFLEESTPGSTPQSSAD